jgi:hypothetical protein
LLYLELALTDPSSFVPMKFGEHNVSVI